MLNRRTFLKVIGAGSAAGVATAPLMRALATVCNSNDSNEFFICIQAQGGWDVTLCTDPRNRRTFVTNAMGQSVQFVEPANNVNTDTSMLAPWWTDDNVTDSVNGDYTTFRMIQPTGSNIAFGPGAAAMTNKFDRMLIVNGVAMNTVSHPDGTAFSATGRHLEGGHSPASSIDTMLGNEFGLDQLLPIVSVNYPSFFVGALDPRAIPLRVSSIGTIATALTRSNSFDTEADRDAVTAMLSQEASELVQRSYYPQALTAMQLQYGSLTRLLSTGLASVFNSGTLETQYPMFNYHGKFCGSTAPSVAFAVEAMKNNMVRVVSFALGSVDTHNSNYRFQCQNQQEIFNILSTLVDYLDATPHPCLTGHTLSEHTHIIVVSDFCRTPQINLAGGRDHYPNNSVVIVSPKFQTNMVYSSSDPAQLLPNNAPMAFSDGTRPIGPPDVLSTFVSAFGIDPRKYLRDGEVVPALLST